MSELRGQQGGVSERVSRRGCRFPEGAAVTFLGCSAYDMVPMGAGRALAPVYLNLGGMGVGSWGRFPGERAACGRDPERVVAREGSRAEM